MNFFSKALLMMDDVNVYFDAQTNILQLNNNVSDEYSNDSALVKPVLD